MESNATIQLTTRFRVFTDLDDTIWEPKKAMKRALRAAYRKFFADSIVPGEEELYEAHQDIRSPTADIIGVGMKHGSTMLANITAILEDEKLPGVCVLDGMELSGFADAIFEGYQQGLIEETPDLLPGAIEALEWMESMGGSIFAVSNKPHAAVVAWANKLGLNRFFKDRIWGFRGLEQYQKPDRGLWVEIHTEHPLEEEMVLVFGDADSDCKFAVCFPTEYGVKCFFVQAKHVRQTELDGPVHAVIDDWRRVGDVLVKDGANGQIVGEGAI